MILTNKVYVIKMEKDKFNLLAYAVAMGDYDRALRIVKELHELYVTTKEDFLASIFKKIENALLFRKNRDCSNEKRLWEEIFELAAGSDKTLSIFAKACYYDSIADSAEDEVKELEYHKKAKREFNKLGDNILTLIASTWIADSPDKRAHTYKEIAKEFKKAHLEDLAYLAMGWHNKSLVDAAEKPEEKVEFYKKAAEEFKEGHDELTYHLVMGEYYVALAFVAEKPEEKAELFKKAAEEFKEGHDELTHHLAMGEYYVALSDAAEKPEEKAEFFKKAAEEFKEGNDELNNHRAMGGYYGALAFAAEKPEEAAELHKKAADEFKEGNDELNNHLAMGEYYVALAFAAEKPEEAAELHKKAADEFKEGHGELSNHLAMGGYYVALALAAEKPEEKAEFYKKAAEEFKEGRDELTHHLAMGGYYWALSDAAEKPEEKVELFKKAAEEFKEGHDELNYHRALGTQYSVRAIIAKKPNEKIKLHKKAADEFKRGKLSTHHHIALGSHHMALASSKELLEEQADLFKEAAKEFKEGKEKEHYHFAMARYYYLSSLLTEDTKKREKLKLRAVKETDWLFIANIALSLSRISTKPGKVIYLIKDAVSSYEKYLKQRGKKLPKFTLFIEGTISDKRIIDDVIKKAKKAFIIEISPFLKNKTVEICDLENIIEATKFVLVIVDNNLGERLSFEIGLAYTAGKPIVLVVPGDLAKLNPLVLKAATVTQKLDTAIMVLRLFSIIKSGEILEVGIDEKEKIKSFLKSIEKYEMPPSKIGLKSPFIEEIFPFKLKYRDLRGDNV
jgi:hypothetical protein